MRFAMVVSATAFLLAGVGQAQHIYYVSAADGHDTNNDGLDDTTPFKTISRAIEEVGEGDFVFVKAGDYNVINDAQAGYDPVNTTDGDSNGIVIDVDDVTIVGYDEDEEFYDLMAGEGVPATYEDFYTPPASLKEMPRIDGLSRALFTGVSITGDNVQFHNFRIRGFQTGVEVASHPTPTLPTSVTVANVVVSEVGDLEKDYDGFGIYLNRQGTNVDNCFVLNACAEGIRVRNSSNELTNCQVYCDDNSSQDDNPNDSDVWRRSPMDYYLVIIGASHNKVKDCHFERKRDRSSNCWPYCSNDPDFPFHGGRVAIEADIQQGESAIDNYIEDCNMINLAEPIALRGSNTKENVIRNIFSYKDPTASGHGVIIIYGAPSENKFEEVYLSGSDYAVGVFTHVGKFQNPLDVMHAGEKNNFTNCIFETKTAAFWFNRRYGATSVQWLPFKDNNFVNCNFLATDPAAVFAQSDRASQNNTFVNCIVDGYTGDYLDIYETGQPSTDANGNPNPTVGDPFPLGFTFIYSCFHNNDSSFPSGNPAGMQIGDPMFASTTFDRAGILAIPKYELLNGSPCDDTGLDFATAPIDDYDGDARTGIIDIGAQER